MHAASPQSYPHYGLLKLISIYTSKTEGETSLFYSNTQQVKYDSKITNYEAEEPHSPATQRVMPALSALQALLNVCKLHPHTGS